MGRLDLDPSVVRVSEHFSAAVGYHALADALRRNPKETHWLDRPVLEDIARNAAGILQGLIEAGEYVDPRSKTSGGVPTWALDL